jgi:hypothetical protein
MSRGAWARVLAAKALVNPAIVEPAIKFRLEITIGTLSWLELSAAFGLFKTN